MGKPEQAEEKALAFFEENPEDGKFAYLQVLHMTEQWDKIVAFYDEQYGDAEMFEISAAHPPYIVVAPALVYRRHRDADAVLASWAEHIDGHVKENPVSGSNEIALAKLAAVKGADSDEVMQHLERAFELGERDQLIGMEPIWRGIEDQNRFNAYVDKTEAAINEERAKIDLPPKALPRNTGG